MKLFCANGCEINGKPYYKTREFNRAPDETSCPECGARLETGMEQRAKKKGGGSLNGGGGGGISPASDAQREKVRGALSIISGKGPCDPAHIWDRRLGGCDDPLCVVPLTRFEHRDYEENRLDILPALIAGGYFAELGHVVTVHEVSPMRLLERTTGETYVTAAAADEALQQLQGRVAELEAGVRA